MKNCIPRILHRIWLGSKPIPKEFERFGEGWRDLHPGWEMRLWTDTNRPPLKNQKAFDTAPSFAAKADILRYEILLQYGGVYVDTDFECLRSIDPLLVDVDCFVAQQKDLDADFGKFCYVNNALIGSVPGHALLRDLVELLEPHMEGLPADMPASFLTGPHFLTSVLQSHPDVRIFPAELFYPYTATERWRRFEKFPSAFGVHHWTLSDTTVTRAKPRTLSSETGNCLTVVIMPSEELEISRLRWVLEGLCLQTVPNFEVFVVMEQDSEPIRQMVKEYMGRLHIDLLFRADREDDRSWESGRNAVLHCARTPRVLFLEADCLPDPDVVETHGRQGKRSALCFGYVRLYPADKYFEFRDAVDYASLWQYSFPEIRNVYITPSIGRWRDVTRCCYSIPRELAIGIGGYRVDSVNEVLDLAERLTLVGCPSVPCIYGARVTRMGSPIIGPAREESARPHMRALRLVLNTGFVGLRKKASGSGYGVNGKSPYVLRVASLAGVKSQPISALAYHLLSEFRSPVVATDAISRVIKRIAIETEGATRAKGLCIGYITQFMATGALVPTGELNTVLMLDGNSSVEKQTSS